MRKVQRASGRPPRYAGTCRHLSKQQVQEKLDAGLKATLRFAVPQNETIEFENSENAPISYVRPPFGDIE